MRFEVGERVCHFASETVFRDLMEGELVTLSIQGADDFIEAHEIPDQWQVLPVAGLIRERECSGDDVAEFANVTHVNATDAGIERKCPAHGTVCLLLRGKRVCEVLVEKRRNDERMIRKPCVRDHAIDLRLTSEVGNVESAAADRFDIWQRGPDKVFHAGSFRGAYRCRSLRELVGALFPKVSDQKNAVCTCERRLKGVRTVQICSDHFVAQSAICAGMAGKGAYEALAGGLQGMYDCASLVSCCANYGNPFFSARCGVHDHVHLGVATIDGDSRYHVVLIIHEVAASARFAYSVFATD
jgi:hypothetical protein